MSANYTYAAYPHAAPPDPAVRPDLFDGVLWRRAFAYVIDLFCIGVIALALGLVFLVLTALSLGLLGPPLWFAFGLIPLAYHTLLVSGHHGATFGMRALDLQVRSWGGERPLFLQALAQGLLFYLTVPTTCGLVLLWALFSRRKRTLHDLLSGLVVVRRPNPQWGPAVGW